MSSNRPALSSEKIAAADLVATLDEYFTAFDAIVSRYGMEKLKTIGDAYMFAGGLPAAKSSHAVDAVLAALEIVEKAQQLSLRHEELQWKIRVGLHSGPVVAGVVGVRKFAFDIWGNAPCRRRYDKDMCARSLEILNRTVMVPMDPRHSAEEIDAIIHNIEVAARVALGGMKAEEAQLRRTSGLDVQKFDMAPTA